MLILVRGDLALLSYLSTSESHVFSSDFEGGKGVIKQMHWRNIGNNMQVSAFAFEVEKRMLSNSGTEEQCEKDGRKRRFKR